MSDVFREQAVAFERAARDRERALTVEQAARRALVARRTAVIQAGVRAPASGIFGRPKGEAKAKG